jgi:K+-transporting ATPase ATPase C chain
MLIAIRFTILILALSGLVYPLAMTGLGQILFPGQAQGSLVKQPDGRIVGSSLIGQAFTQPKYFHSRPAVNDYDASNSGGSNLAVTSQKLLDRVSKDASAYQNENPAKQSIPVDAVTASASSLDPHISLANALIQAPRVANARHMALNQVKSLLEKRVEKPLFAEAPYVNVLELNLALDREIP